MAKVANFLRSRLAGIAWLGLVCFGGGLSVLAAGGLARGPLAPLDGPGLTAAIATVVGAIVTALAFAMLVHGKHR